MHSLEVCVAFILFIAPLKPCVLGVKYVLVVVGVGLLSTENDLIKILFP